MLRKKKRFLNSHHKLGNIFFECFSFNSTQLTFYLFPVYSKVHRVPMRLAPPTRYPTPYGGRLEWYMLGGNKLVVHLKDKTKIRIKKRWSQVSSRLVTRTKFYQYNYFSCFSVCQFKMICIINYSICFYFTSY